MKATIRTYGRSELAQLYFPCLTQHSAWLKLRDLMTDNALLSPILATGRRTFMPAEVEKIFVELGAPC